MSDEHVEDHKVFRTYTFVIGVVVVALLNHFKFIQDELAAQLIGILLAGAVAAMRYGQVQDAKTVKTALHKQQAVVKEAVARVAARNEELELEERKEKPCPEPSNSMWTGSRKR